jgi:hypothetical protein
MVNIDIQQDGWTETREIKTTGQNSLSWLIKRRKNRPEKLQ